MPLSSIAVCVRHHFSWMTPLWVSGCASSAVSRFSENVYPKRSPGMQVFHICSPAVPAAQHGHLAVPADGVHLPRRDHRVHWRGTPLPGAALQAHNFGRLGCRASLLWAVILQLFLLNNEMHQLVVGTLTKPLSAISCNIAVKPITLLRRPSCSLSCCCWAAFCCLSVRLHTHFPHCI